MKLFQKKNSIVVIILSATLVLGIGLIVWALINIRAQSVQLINQESQTEAIVLAQIKPSLDIVQEDIIQEDIVPNDIILDYPYPVKEIQEDIVSELSKPLNPVDTMKSDTIGILSIPVLDRELPIVEGTDVEALKLGVGHFSGSVLPGENDNCVLSGHRDTVFTELDELELGDQLIVITTEGTFVYEIKDIRIVDKDDKTVIVPTDHAVLTLTTCYPFNYIGNAPDRYIVSADLIN
ncbi:MAG: class D sortase [Vallitaleaceae bacterium]|jgi:sortase A|nr:class D sortase [Vallitaleaceae bacterium]